jgi:signal transduction histidine kinase
VLVTVREEGRQASISVADQGPGIPRKELPHIGERFFRGGDPNTRRTRGTGLGLALVKEILRLHDSELEIESQLDEGSRFSFRLALGVRAGTRIHAS